MRVALPAVILRLLDARRADRTGAAGEDATRALLEARGYVAHAPALAFDAAYGGLRFSRIDVADDWDQTGEPDFLVGAHAFVSATRETPRGGDRQRSLSLVPVLRAPDDLVYFLDESGRAYGQDTAEDREATPCAPDGRAMLCRVILWDTVYALGESHGARLAGRRGAEIARELGLRPIDEASDDDERWWGDGDTFVVERAGATALASTSGERVAPFLEEDE